jgi:hypothetical protein
MLHLKIERPEGERLLRAMKLPQRTQCATERYNRRQRDTVGPQDRLF